MSESIETTKTKKSLIYFQTQYKNNTFKDTLKGNCSMTKVKEITLKMMRHTEEK